MEPPGLTETIAAVATPFGTGGIALIRISGPDALLVAARVFQSKIPATDAAPYTLHPGLVRNGPDLVDRAVLGVFRAPHSYTGEDVAEISCHGGTEIAQTVLALCLAAGARPADPGEFTRRAFLNGKMDLTQAEAVAELIASRSAAQRRLAADRLEGGLAVVLKSWKQRLVALLARLEAGLDFAEEEIPDLDRAALARAAAEVGEEMDQWRRASIDARLWREGLRLALIGRPNAGKSSLFNALLRHDRAIVTAVPGTTRDTLEETVTWNGIPVIVTDTAGLRSSADPVETLGADRARRAAVAADQILFLVDGHGPLHSDDHAAALPFLSKPVVFVSTKADLGGTDDPARRRIELGFPPGAALNVSAVTGEGLDLLRREVLRCAGNGTEPVEPAHALNARQERLIGEARSALERVRGAALSVPEEALAIDLRESLDRLAAVTGEGTSEDVLNEIFSTFCIGK